VIRKKRAPALGWLGISRRPLERGDVAFVW